MTTYSYKVNVKVLSDNREFTLYFDEDTQVDILEYTKGTFLNNLREGETITGINFLLKGFGWIKGQDVQPMKVLKIEKL